MLELCWMHLLLADAVWVTVMTSRIESCWWIYEKWCWASAAGNVCPDCTTHLLSCSLILINTHWSLTIVSLRLLSQLGLVHLVFPVCHGLTVSLEDVSDAADGVDADGWAQCLGAGRSLVCGVCQHQLHWSQHHTRAPLHCHLPAPLTTHSGMNTLSSVTHAICFHIHSLLILIIENQKNIFLNPASCRH